MTKILAVGMIILSMSTIGCSGCDDSKNKDQQIRYWQGACMSSPECMSRVSAGQYASAYNVLQTGNPQILTGGANGAPAVLPYKTASLTDKDINAAIKDKNSKVAQEIKKIADNPNSSYYDPPTSNVVPRARESDAGLPTQADQVGLGRAPSSAADEGGGVR